ncbi:MAG: hypothetical protein KA146_01405 [Leptospiraceae bacterium]|jgi:hypothetical protein|nr:hypothetical protein [Leptospiraceae bacterium]
MVNPNFLSKTKENSDLRILLFISVFCLIFSTTGLIIDDRILNYSPLWLKPFKFAVSSIIYAVSLLYLTSLIPKQKFLKIANLITSYGLIVELIIIYLQAYRGRMSHFNFLTLEDMILFQIMAFAIVAVWICLIVYVIGFFMLDANGDVLIHSIRVGLIITFLSMVMAFTMTQPSKEDIQKAEQNKGPIGLVMGSHSVGEKDETKRLPLTSWARTGGDLRIAHFIGLHALQILPFFGFLFRRLKFNYTSGLWIVYAIGILYLGLTLFSLIQALNGIPVI